MTIKTAILGYFIVPMFLTATVVTISTDTKKEAVTIVPSQQITTSIESETVNRKKILTAFFQKNKSPLIAHIDEFLKTADRYNLDYRLLPAISCVESSCGKNLIQGSFNPFGWGIYGNNVIRFTDYDQAIATVGAGLHKGYISKGLTTPELIEPVYTPPSKGSWRRGVRFFMGQMDTIADASL